MDTERVPSAKDLTPSTAQQRAEVIIKQCFLKNEREWRDWYAMANSGTALQPCPPGVAPRLLEAFTQALQTARQEALREAAQQARFGAMELRAMNEPLGTDSLGYGQKALQDFADILDRLASEGA